MSRLLFSVVVGAEKHHVFRCVQSLSAVAGRQHSVTVRVTCNEPNQALKGELIRSFPGVTILENTSPRGFAANHNQALMDADADYALIANDDLVFLPGSINQVLEFLERPENRTVAALSPRLLNPDGTLQRSTYRFPTVPRALLDLAGIRKWIPYNEFTYKLARLFGRGSGRSRFWPHDRTCDVDTFRGAAMYVRLAAWNQVGPLLEYAVVGGEIADWHRRCRNLGWRVVFFADSSVVHHGSRTVSQNRLLQSEYLKGYVAYFKRHRSSQIEWGFRVSAIPVATARLAAAGLSGDRIGARLWLANLAVLISARPPSLFDSSS